MPKRMRGFGHLVRMPPRHLPREVFRARHTGGRPPGKTQETLEGPCLLAGLGTPRDPLGIPSEQLDEVAGEREVRASLLEKDG